VAARRLGGAHGREYLIRHEMTEPLVFETLRHELVGGDHARDTLHVYGDIYGERGRRGLLRQRRA